MRVSTKREQHKKEIKSNEVEIQIKIGTTIREWAPSRAGIFGISKEAGHATERLVLMPACLWFCLPTYLSAG